MRATQGNSSTSNFKKLLKYGRFLLESVLIILFCVLLDRMTDYLVTEDVLNVKTGKGVTWERALMHDFYTEDRNIDNLFLGSSRVYSTIRPEKLNEITGENSFALSSALLRYNACYYLLREADKENDLSRVYIEMHYYLTQNVGESYDDRQSYFRSIEFLHEMPISLNKLEYMTKAVGKDYWPIVVFKGRRYSKNLFDNVHNNVRLKENEEYKNYALVETGNDEIAYYDMNGYYHNLNKIPGNMFCSIFNPSEKQYEPFEDEKWGKAAYENIEKIIEYCQKRNIDVVLFSAPIPDFWLYRKGGYDKYVAQVNKLAEKHNISYYDFNLCNPKYMDLKDTQYFYDESHLNVMGVELFTPILAQIMLHESSGKELPDDLFIDSYEEKIELLGERMYGIRIDSIETPVEDEMNRYKITPYTTFAGPYEYRISKTLAGKENRELVMDWTNECEYELPKSERGKAYIEFKVCNSEDIYHIEIIY